MRLRDALSHNDATRRQCMIGDRAGVRTTDGAQQVVILSDGVVVGEREGMAAVVGLSPTDREVYSKVCAGITALSAAALSHTTYSGHEVKSAHGD
jgi:hypothetical protein